MDIQQIIKERYDGLPNDLQIAIKASDLPSKLDAISKKGGLHIDQAGGLQLEVMLVMLGLENSDDFVENLSKNLEISKVQASMIATDVNLQIFDSVRHALQKNEDIEDAEPASINGTNTALEQAGDFTIEKQPESLEIVASTATPVESGLDKEKILNAIENPTLHNAGPVNILEQNGPDIVDHMLAAPTIQPNVQHTVSESPKMPPVREKMPSRVDPYREPIQ